MGERVETVKISIQAPGAVGSREVKPEVVKQLWRDVLGEFPFPRAQESWPAVVMALRQSLEQDGLDTIFEYPAKHDDEVTGVVQRALLRFISVRTPVNQYVGRRYDYKSKEEQLKKAADVRFRCDLAAKLFSAVIERRMVVDLPTVEPGVNANRDCFPPGVFVEAAIAGYMDIHQRTVGRLAKSLGVPAKLLGDTQYSNMATAAQMVPGDNCFSLINPPRQIGPFPMREDIPVQPIHEAITESLNRIKKTTCKHCNEEVFWVRTGSKVFLAEDLSARYELADIDEKGVPSTGDRRFVCEPHRCPAIEERVRWPKSKRPEHPLKERLWTLLVQAGVQGGAATQLIDTAFKPEVIIPIDRREGTAQGDALEEAKAAFEQAEQEAKQKEEIVIPAASKPPLREWGVIHEMAQLLRETADRGSELNLADRERLRVTADLAEQAVVEGMKRAVVIGVGEACQHTIGIPGETVAVELAKIEKEVKRIIDTFKKGHIHPIGPAVPLLGPGSEGSEG